MRIWMLGAVIAALALPGCAPGPMGPGECTPGDESGDACTDGCSNDGDPLADCDDPDCAAEPACAVPCGDGRVACVADCVDLATSPAHCGRCGHACAPAELCSGGACAALAECPPGGCPLGSICDLATNRCIAGCTADGGCPSVQICQARACVTGCRSDAACGAGRICESMSCRLGCRADVECGAGRICDALSCRAGCRDHGACGTDEICDLAALRCVAGCLDDSACDAGEICEGSTCRRGCRADGGCAAGEICEALSCRAGCRDDLDCGADATCVASSLACAACPADPDEARDTMIATSGATASESRTRVLCGPGDEDTVAWHHSPTGLGSSFEYEERIAVEISGAEATATTDLALRRGGSAGTWATDSVVGNGAVVLRHVRQTISCGSFGCGGEDWAVDVSTDSETPVTAIVRVTWSRR
jgi:hypothetical protein